jgi:hypothetical protein
METDSMLTHRQKARLADLHLLLDKVLDTNTLTLQKELKRRGLLTQLQFVAANNYGLGYLSALRKICRVVESLTFSEEDLLARRSAQGSFADVLRALAKNTDKEVRNRAAALLPHPPPAVMAGDAPRGATGSADGSGGGRKPLRVAPEAQRSARSTSGSALGAWPSERSADSAAALTRPRLAPTPQPPERGAPSAPAANSAWHPATAASSPTADAAPSPTGDAAPVPPPEWLPAAAAVGQALALQRAAGLDLQQSPAHVVGTATDVIEGLNMGLYGAAAMAPRPLHRALAPR